MQRVVALGFRTLRTNSEKFQLVIEIVKSGIFSDFRFQLMNRAGGLDRLDAPTIGANQVVAVISRDEKGEIGRSFMQSQSAHHSVFGQSLQQPKDGHFVTRICQARSEVQFRKCHGASGFQQRDKQFLQGLGSPKTQLAATVEGLLKCKSCEKVHFSGAKDFAASWTACSPVSGRFSSF